MTPTNQTNQTNPINQANQPKQKIAKTSFFKKVWLIIAQLLAIFFVFFGAISWLNQQKIQLPSMLNHLLNPIFGFFKLPILGENQNLIASPTVQPPAPAPASIIADLGPQASYRETAKRALPLVVNITTSKARQMRANPLNPLFEYFFGLNPDGSAPNLGQAPSSGSSQNNAKNKPQNVPYGLGSGVIMRQDGYIMTNNHVVEGADQIEVTFYNGEKIKATLVGADKETDLALLKVEKTSLPSIQINQDIAVGDVVLAIGNPFGVGQTITSGIVSALGRNELGINTFENFIQTDAAINPGNSGGALVDSNGKLAGINTAIFSKSGGWQGIGFAIPADTVLEIMNDLLKEGRVLRGYLGVSPQDLNQAIRDVLGKDVEGALIADIIEGGPANQAGLEKGDIIISINQKAIANSQQLLNMIAKYKPNTEVECVVLRQQKTIKIKVQLGTRPAPNNLNNSEKIPEALE